MTCTSFFTVLMRVDKTGLQFYFFLSPFFNSKHFFPTVFTTVLQTAKKKKKKKKKKKSFVGKFFIFIFYSLIFFRVYRIVEFWSCRFELLL